MREIERKLRILLLGVGAFFVASCGKSEPKYAQMCSAQLQNDCLPPERIEQMLIDPRARIMHSERTQGGGADAQVMVLSVPDGEQDRQIRVKWRAHSTASAINSPRKEVVAHFVQKLFLEPVDYVAPPSRSRCFELEHYHQTVDANAQPSFPEHSRCVFGVVSFWLEGAEGHQDDFWEEEKVFTLAKWKADAVYRRSFADANLLAYLISNGDTHSGNWIKLPTKAGVRMYLIDSSISLTRMGNSSISPEEDFSTLRVPALSQLSVERILQLKDDEIESLFTLERLIKKGHVLVSYEGHHEPEQGDRGRAVRWVESGDPNEDNDELLIGIANYELDLIKKQIWYLRALHAMGELQFLNKTGGARR